MESYIYILLIITVATLLIYWWTNRCGAVSEEEIKERDVSFALKMQAYERFALFLERSKPASLLLRLVPKTTDAMQLKIALLETIRQEFEHNNSQQIYISEVLWKRICLTKDRLFQLIEQTAKQGGGQSAQVLAENLLREYAREQNFVEETLQLLRAEARMVQNN